MATVNNIAVIILAAGESSRLGSPKQLLPYAGETLLQYTIQVALNTIARRVIVVLGAHEKLMKTATAYTGLHIVINREWKEGMASSVRCGINELIKTEPHTTGAVILLCDQPFVTASLINALIDMNEKTGKAIIASRYVGTFGAPTFFHKSIFPELLRLEGDVGAKAIIRRHPDDVESVEFSKGNVDIDTAADYGNLTKGDLDPD